MGPMVSSGFPDDFAADRKESGQFLSIRGISKQFGSLWANRDISMDIRQGEIHALVGENGAGKSTLLKILFGQLRADSGTIFLEGQPCRFRRPSDAMGAGFGMVHQQLLIFPQLSALENIILGREPGHWGGVLWKVAQEKVEGLMRLFGFSIPLLDPAGSLPFAHRQQIEILRALHHNAHILLLDEPTSLLGPRDVDRFMDLLSALRNRGHTVLFVSHRLAEVFRIADRISVLHRGRFQGTHAADEITPGELAGIMVSGVRPQALPTHADLSPGAFQHREGEVGAPMLQILNVHTDPVNQESGLQDLTLEVFPGEILGIGAVVGNGERALARLIAGLSQPVRGEVRFKGQSVSNASVSTRMGMGIHWLPANPLEEGLAPDRPLWENLLLGRQRASAFQTNGWLKKRQIRDWTVNSLEAARVGFASPFQRLRSLSGGNQQKVALSRVMTDSTVLAVMEQPSRGLDVGAQEEIHRRMRGLCARGAALVVIAYDVDEVLALCHRVGILFRGRLMGTVAKADASRDLLGRWMVGIG